MAVFIIFNRLKKVDAIIMFLVLCIHMDLNNPIVAIYCLMVNYKIITFP